MNNYNLANDFGEMQYNLILLDLQSLSEEEKHIKMQHHFNEFKAILNVSLEHADIMQSKYMPLLLAYQQLFNFKGGCVPKLDGIDTGVDTTEMEKRIVKYLEEKAKNEKKERKEMIKQNNEVKQL